jgi:general secretion pathway protein N
MSSLPDNKHAKGWRPSVAGVLCVSLLAVGVADAAVGGDVVTSNPVELQPLQELTATHERPLFSPARRPPPKVVAPLVVQHEAAPPPPPAPPNVVVLGIVSEDGESRAAIRSTDKLPNDKRPADKVMRVRAGDDVGGWTVARIEPRRLVLTQGERSVDFVLFGAADKAVRSADAAARGRQVR